MRDELQKAEAEQAETEEQRRERLLRNRPKPNFPKRFYTQVTVSPEGTILLDGKPVKTPLRANLTLPNKALAQAVADEWQAQYTHINPHSMPLTRLANTAIDRATLERQKIEDEIVQYAASDLLLYRVEQPQALQQRQSNIWDPLLEAAARKLGHRFVATTSLNQNQPPQALAALRHYVQGLSGFELIALHYLVTLSGSTLLGLLLVEGAITAEQAWAAAHLEEDWQVEHWGQDAEALARRQARAAEFLHSINFLQLLAKE